MKNNASNAVTAKAHAKHGKQLTVLDYRDIMSCETVPDIASYLKNNTHYANALSEINENVIHRQQLEQYLKESIFDDINILRAYDTSSGGFSSFFIRSFEITELLRVISSVKAGIMQKYSPPFFKCSKRFSSLDFEKLALVDTFEDMLGAIRGTDYYGILLPFSTENSHIDYAQIEKTLYDFLFASSYREIENIASKNTRLELTALLDTYVDISNYFLILRLKFVYKASSEDIIRRIAPYGTLKNKKKLMSALEAESISKLTLCFPNIIGKQYRADASEPSYRESFLYVKFLHRFRFSTSPAVVLFSYFILSSIEVFDITTVIESVFYKVPPSDIIKLLTVVNIKGGD